LAGQLYDIATFFFFFSFFLFPPTPFAFFMPFPMLSAFSSHFSYYRCCLSSLPGFPDGWSVGDWLLVLGEEPLYAFDLAEVIFLKIW